MKPHSPLTRWFCNPDLSPRFLRLAALLCLLGGQALATDTTPPVLTITFPQSSGTYTTTISAFSIRGNATDDVAVTQVTWTNNAGGSGTATLGTGTWNCPANTIPLQLGNNVLTITAFDAAGNSSTKTLTVRRNAAQLTIYYVATNGNNGNNGTSLATPFLTVQKGVSTAGSAPGNTLYIRAGLS